MDPTTLVYIGAASAIGGLLGTLATMQVAKKQIHAQVVLGERMKWISLLRDSIAAFLGCLTDFTRYDEFKKAGDTSLEGQWHTTMSRAPALHANIMLLLNPHEADHSRLSKLLTLALNEIIVTKNHNKADAIIEEVLTTSQTILKREWERVKKGE